jgi:hypothetical protein
MKGYELSRVWFAYAYDHPEKFTPIDTALYFWIVEVFNRARWPEKIYLPSSQAMQHIGCKSYKAYINSFNKLESEGFIIVAERSKNQYTANIIALVSEAKALTEPSTKATTNASTEAHTEPSTKASTVYKNIEHTTDNREKGTPSIFTPNDYYRAWDIPFGQEFLDKMENHKSGKDVISKLSEAWENFCQVRYKAHNKRYHTDISEAQAINTFLKQCKSAAHAIESLERCVAVESINPFVIELVDVKGKQPKLNHYGFDVSRLG